MENESKLFSLMEDFRKEITQWKKDNPVNPHTPEIKEEDLTEEDLQVWLRVKTRSITRKDIDNYQAKLAKDIETAPKDVKKSRLAFQAVWADRAQVLILDRAQKEK